MACASGTGRCGRTTQRAKAESGRLWSGATSDEMPGRAPPLARCRAPRSPASCARHYATRGRRLSGDDGLRRRRGAQLTRPQFDIEPLALDACVVVEEALRDRDHGIDEDGRERSRNRGDHETAGNGREDAYPDGDDPVDDDHEAECVEDVALPPPRQEAGAGERLRYARV